MYRQYSTLQCFLHKPREYFYISILNLTSWNHVLSVVQFNLFKWRACLFMESMHFALMREHSVPGLDILQQNTTFFVHCAEYGKARREQIYPRNQSVRIINAAQNYRKEIQFNLLVFLKLQSLNLWIESNHSREWEKSKKSTHIWCFRIQKIMLNAVRKVIQQHF